MGNRRYLNNSNEYKDAIEMYIVVFKWKGESVVTIRRKKKINKSLY